MNYTEVAQKISSAELKFFTSRSSGPGGQNVNKVNTKVELRFDIINSLSFTDDEKKLIVSRLHNKITTEGELILTSQTERTQTGNKEKVLEKFYKLIASSLTIKPKRKPTGPTKSSKAERLRKKKIRSDVKRARQRSQRNNEE